MLQLRNPKRKINLVNERESHGLTQSEMAGILGITLHQYGSIERGGSEGSMRVWKELSNYFNRPIDYLIREQGRFGGIISA
jgi:transcriptional regulator with XRE-family HTH domain